MEMVQDYFSRALKRWDVELIGCIPELKALSHPSIADFSKLFQNAEIVSGGYVYLLLNMCIPRLRRWNRTCETTAIL